MMRAIWQRRKGTAIVVFLGVFSCAAAFTLSLPNLYRATATVLVARQQISEAFVRSSITAELETRIQMIQQEIMSRTRLEGVIDRFALYSDIRRSASLDAVVERMRRDIQLELKSADQSASGRSTTIAFSLSYTHADPDMAARVANALTEVYVTENTRSREQQATRTAEFLKAQLEDVKAELESHVSRESQFKSEHMGELPQQVEANLASLERLNTQLRLNADRELRATERKEKLEHQLAEAAAPPLPPPATATEPAAELFRLRQQLTDLRRRFSDKYPDVIRIRLEIETLERQQAVSGPQAAAHSGSIDIAGRLRAEVGDANAELQSLKKEGSALRRAMSEYEHRVDAAPRRDEEFQLLSRDSAATRERYNALLQRYQEAQLASSMELAQRDEQFRILDAALPPQAPAAPARARLLIMGLVVALALACGAALIAERLDTAFHSADELRAFTTVPTLIQIPRIVTSADTRRRRWRLAFIAVATAAGLGLVGAGAHRAGREGDDIVRLMVRGRP